MSSIEKLSIQGIRSFGVNSSDRQEMKFSSPLTLIVGQNGCGKTTIIECLKYGLTGEVPPGSNRGQSFVHDPTIFSSNECRGQVKLKVQNINGEKVTVIRTMRMSQKRSKWSFETLEALLNFENEKGEAISRRIQDVDAEMIQFMGVSKAIINNVLFCHQEESSWPLDEGKKLKEKFDAIFGTTEYNKAIDKLIKMRKEQTDELKVKEANLKHLIFLKKELEDKNLNLERTQIKMNALEEKSKEVDGEVMAIEAELEKLTEVECKYSSFQKEKYQVHIELKNSEEQLDKLRSKIKTKFDGSMDDLEKEIENFRDKMEEKKRELNVLAKKMDSERSEEKKINDEIQELRAKKSRILDQRQQEQDYLGERASKIKELCKRIKIPLISEDLECRGRIINEQLESIKSAIIAEEEKIGKTSAEFDEMDKAKQKVIDDLRVESTKIETDIELKKKQKQELEVEKVKQKRSQDDIEKKAQELKQMNDSIQEIDKKMEEMKNMFNFDEEKQKIFRKQQENNKLDDDFREVDKKLTFLNTISVTLSQISGKKSDIEKKEQAIKLLKNKHNSNIQMIFGSRAASITENYRRQVNVEQETTKKKIREMELNIEKLKLSKKEFEIKRKNLRDELKKMQKELDEATEKIEEVCGSSSYQDLLAKSKENVAKYQREYSAQKSSESMFKNYISKIDSEPCCPLCHKDLSSHEQSSLSCELSEKIEHLPQDIKKFELLLKKEQKKYESLNDLKPSIERVSKLEAEIPKTKENLKKLDSDFEEVSSDLENLEIILSEPKSNLDVINSMLVDMSHLDNYCIEKEQLSKDLAILQAKLPSGEQENIEDVKLLKQTIDAEKNAGRILIDKMQKAFDGYKDKLDALKDRRNNLKDKQIHLQEGIQSLPKIKERIEEITKKLQELTLEITSLEQKKQPLKNRLEANSKEKESANKRQKETLNKMRNDFDSVKRVNNDIERLSKELTSLEQLNLNNTIQNLKETFKNVEKKQHDKESSIKALSEKIENLKTQTLTQESEERNLMENKEYKIMELKKNEFQVRQDNLKKNMGDMDIEKVISKRKELIGRREKLHRSKGEMAGQIGEIRGQIKTMEAAISRPEYKDAEKNYRKSFYEVEINKKVINDLGQYRVVLEKALLKFHSERMDAINKLLYGFWKTIYRGNDIEYIKIKTDDDNTAGSADKKRSFSYRVVQCKNKHEIDMRGRCSAGQRVLACLIIRMALAETFSVNCGVLALDEPTTNLDRQNILALCDALNELIEQRGVQHNFMLIVITHDEDFIQSLGGRVECYHRILRNADGKSEIRQVSLLH